MLRSQGDRTTSGILQQWDLLLNAIKPNQGMHNIPQTRRFRIYEVTTTEQFMALNREIRCDADPNTLSQYVVALLKKHKSDKELKEFCLDQLDVFLQHKTKGFVEMLFETLTSKSYEKETPPPPPPPPLPTIPTIPTVPTVPPPPPPPPAELASTPAVLTPVNQNQPVKTVEKRKKSEEGSRPEDGDKDNHRRHSGSPTSRARARDGDRDDRRRRYDDRNRFPNERRYPRYGDDFNRRRSRSRSRERSPRNRSWASQNRGRGWSPQDRSRSPYPHARSHSRSRSYSPGRSRSPRGRRPETDSRGSTPVQDNGKYSTETDNGANSVSVPSAITVVSRSGTDNRYDWNSQTGRNTPPVNIPPPPHSRPRCKDYDEKGFCMRGDLCPYDHGLDPVVVEDINIPPVLPFPPPGPPPPPGMPGLEPMPPGAGPRMSGPRMSGPRMSGPRMSGPRMSGPRMSGPRQSGPRPPPGPPGTSGPRGPRPPRSAHENFQPEGYNPEAPAINLPRPPPGFWTGPRGPRPPQPFNSQPPPPPPPVRGRDLVQVQTVPQPREEEPAGLVVPAPSHGNENSRTVVAPKRPYEKISQPPPPPGVPLNQNQSHMSQPPAHNRYSGPPPKRHFDFNRLGSYRQGGFNPENATLEVRKVPKEFNNIAKLNEHFGKFGTLVNIQVSYDGDPEAALITYSYNAEANSAYRSSEPVFNNRFIKLFWHKEKTTTQQPGSVTPQHTQQELAVEDHRISIKSRLGAIPSPDKMQLNNLIPKPSQAPEKSLIYTSTVGSLTKTVFNPVALKNLISPTTVKPPDLTTHRKVEEQASVARKHDTLKKKLELQKQKQQLLQKYIEQQKLLLGKIEKSKNMTAEDKALLMKTIKDLSKKIDTLKSELMPKKTSPESFKSEAQAKKEILDTELELMTKQHAGDDTSDLKRRLADLTREAASMGLLAKGGRGRGRGAAVTRGRGRGFSTWSWGGRGAARGRGLTGPARTNRTLDRRPKQLKVSGFDTEDKNDLLLHLAQHGEVENIDFNDIGQNAMVTFKTRMDAEKVALNANQFKGKSLVMKWHTPGISSTSLSLSDDTLDEDEEDDDLDDVGVAEEEEIDEDALLAPDDEEEEDEESRSWRR